MALAVAKLADALVRGRIASLEDRQTAWPYPGRKRTFFDAERDRHEGSLRALMLSQLPAPTRRAQGQRADPADGRAARHREASAGPAPIAKVRFPASSLAWRPPSREGESRVSIHDRRRCHGRA
jgi:hypothetical protein